MVDIDEMATFCKRKGFVYPNSEIYGGMAGFFDYGPLGVELKNNIKQSWWKYHVQDREDIVGIDGSIISHPHVWEASGHVGCFADVLVECTKCHERYRGDVLIEDTLKIQADGLKAPDIDKLVEQNKIVCPKCQSPLGKSSEFNLMFKTHVGPKVSDESVAYLRPETAQLIFTNFKLVQDNARLKLPFGIAQVGKAFRNEISPRNFLFRCREFEQMEIEYFINPGAFDDCPFIDEVMDQELTVYSAEMQQKNQEPEKMTVTEALDRKIFKSPWHAYWLAVELRWFFSLGARQENFRVRQHLPDEKAHYSKDCWDLEYNFPFGWKELQGIADRGDFDLQQHIKHSKKDLSLYDEDTKKKIVPHVVAEPSLGVSRSFLVILFDAYQYDKKRDNIVLKLHPKLAPFKLGVFPLVNKLNDQALKLFQELKKDFACRYDKSGAIGRRYYRMDETGTPYCVTYDFQTEEDQTVTLRERDTQKQVRIKITDLKNILSKLIEGEIGFEKAGTPIKGE